MMAFGLFHTWNAMYAGARFPGILRIGEGSCSMRTHTPGISSRLMRWRRWAGTIFGSGEVTFPSRRAWIRRYSCWPL